MKNLFNTLDYWIHTNTDLRCDLATLRDELKRLKAKEGERRVMKIWTSESHPKEPDMYWIADADGYVDITYVSKDAIKFNKGNVYTHWLELEPTPILPNADVAPM